MKFQTSKEGPLAVASKMLVQGCFEGEIPFGGQKVNNRIKLEGFTGKLGEHFIHFNDVAKATRLLVVGLGPRDKFDVKALRKVLTTVLKLVKDNKLDEVTFAPKVGEVDIVGAETFGENLATYAGLVDYVINHQKTARGKHKSEIRLQTVTVLVDDATDAGVTAGLAKGQAIGEAVNFARDLSNMPAGQLTPNRLAAFAQAVARKSGGTITCRLLRGAQLRRIGAHALLAVAQGSTQPPVLIDLTYTPKTGATDDVLGFVGKSITFDSGGLDLKTADGMRTMKRDMAGGASVLAALSAIAKLELPVSVRVVMAATENMPDGDSYKPGDVLKTMAGLTVEVDNTDAEGRLTLADGIEYIKRQNASKVIDLATLTGAQRSISSDVGAAGFGNNDEFSGLVAAAAKSAGERVMFVEMWEEFRDGNKTDMADLKNSGGDPGSVTAAWFLREFAGEKTPWVHLDIAGPSFRSRELGPDPKGSTGFGVRLLVELARLSVKK